VGKRRGVGDLLDQLRGLAPAIGRLTEENRDAIDGLVNLRIVYHPPIREVQTDRGDQRTGAAPERVGGGIGAQSPWLIDVDTGWLILAA
jgi:hypothetical protein